MDKSIAQPFTPAAFRRAWADDTLNAESVGRKFGIGLHAAHWRAKALGLPKKPRGRPSKIDRAALADMWAAGVSLHGIALHFNVHETSIWRSIHRAALPKRKPDAPDQMTLARYRETLLAAAMADTARIEQRQFKLAEMWDQPGHHTSGKRKAA